MPDAEAPRVLAVALMKSGTHLMQELLIALGYHIAGAPRIPDQARVRPSRAEAEQLIRLSSSDLDMFALERAPDEEFWRQARDAWDAAQDRVQSQLGTPLERHYGRENVSGKRLADAYVPFSATPEGTSWIVSELAIDRVDGAFWDEWATTKEPRVIFMYRDPRATTLSMVNFLLDASGKGFGDYQDFRILHEILSSITSPDEQLEFALTHPGFPAVGDHARMRWLLRHPRVVAVSYESLVGPEGGGSAEEQEKAVDRVCDHLGADPGVRAAVASSLYNEDAFTFRQGDIAGWRQQYSDANLQRANRLFERDLHEYGYDQ